MYHGVVWRPFRVEFFRCHPFFQLFSHFFHKKTFCWHSSQAFWKSNERVLALAQSFSRCFKNLIKKRARLASDRCLKFVTTCFDFFKKREPSLNEIVFSTNRRTSNLFAWLIFFHQLRSLLKKNLILIEVPWSALKREKNIAIMSHGRLKTDLSAFVLTRSFLAKAPETQKGYVIHFFHVRTPAKVH